MKKFLYFCFAMLLTFGVASTANASKKETKLQTTTFKVDIHCHQCVNKIMNNVPMLGRGVTNVQIDLDKKQATVVYDTAKNNEEKIIKGFASLKVKAEPIKKEEKK